MRSKPETVIRHKPRRATALRCIVAVVAAGVLALALGGCDNNRAPEQHESAASVGQKLKLVEPKPKRRFADAATVRKRVIGHTFTGEMGPAVVTEFYAPGGAIHGGGYRAQWEIDRNRLCLNYDEAPDDDCYDIRFDGQIMQWWHDGEVTGQGVLVTGNPNHL